MTVRALVFGAVALLWASMAGAQTPYFIDADGNGLWEIATIVDADGDGRNRVKCVAKDDPEPQCKGPETLVLDWADDLGCMINGCNGFPPLVEKTATVNLFREAAINFPCSRPGGTNDPSDPTTHDSTSDPAYQDCPAWNDDAGEPAGLRMSQLSLGGWQGTIVGIGVDRSDTRQATLTANDRGRTRGSYIVNDFGNVDAAWFGSSNFQHSIHFGLARAELRVNMAGRGSYTGNTGGGWSRLRIPNEITRECTDVFNVPASGGGQQTSGSADGFCDHDGITEKVEDTTATTLLGIEEFGNNPFCACESNTPPCNTSDSAAPSVPFTTANWTERTRILIGGDAYSATTKTSHSLVSPKTAGPYSQGDCPADSVEVEFAVLEDVDPGGGYGTSPNVLPAQIREIQDDDTTGGTTLGLWVLRDEFFDSAAQIRNVTFEPQDSWNDPDGDCDETGLWDGSGTSDPSTDDDCDTTAHAAFQGGNMRPAIVDSVIKYGHFYAVDGDSQPHQAHCQMLRVEWIYHQGQAIMDPGHGWRICRWTVSESSFVSNIIATFGSTRWFEHGLIRNSNFDQITAFTSSRHDRFWTTRIESSSFRSAFGFSCGAQGQHIENLYATGRVNANRIGNRGLINMRCDDPTDPIAYNTFAFLKEDPPGGGGFPGGLYDRGAGQVLVMADNADGQDLGIGPNSWHGLASYHDILPSKTPASTNHAMPGCLFATLQRGGDIVEETGWFARQAVSGSMVEGELVCEFGNSGVFDDLRCTDADGNGVCDIDKTIASTSTSTDDPVVNTWLKHAGKSNYASIAPIELDPTSEVAIFDSSATATTNRLAKAMEDRTLVELCCTATGATTPVAQVIEAVNCNANGGSCLSTGLSVTLSALTTEVCDATATDDSIAAGEYFGSQVASVTTPADLAHCTLESYR